MMQSYWLFLAISVVAIATPGPGVILTVSNALRHGFARSVPGIAGVALGMIGVGVASFAGLGIVLSSSAVAFTFVKYLGAAYLVYLGATRLLGSRSSNISRIPAGSERRVLRRVAEGASVTLLNPKAYLLYASLFPQFIDPFGDYLDQFAVLGLTFSGLMVVIHSLYCVVASVAKERLLSPRWSNFVTRITGGVFIGLGIGAAATTR
jgi:homoserine/homoserine lactone efflux protein